MEDITNKTTSKEDESILFIEESISKNPGEEVLWHDEEQLLIYKCLAGEGMFKTTGSSFWIKEGEAFLLAPRVPFSLKASGDTFKYQKIGVLPSFIEGDEDSLIANKYIKPILSQKALAGIKLNLSSKLGKKILPMIDKTIKTAEEEKSGYEIELRNEWSNMAFLLYENFENRIDPTFKKNQYEKRLHESMVFIEANLGNEISLELIAKHLGCSPRECVRTYETTIGISPIQYVLKRRLKEAAKLLQSKGSLSVSSIAKTCGFKSPAYFGKQFLKEFGVTPLQYSSNYDITNWTEDPLAAFENFYLK